MFKNWPVSMFFYVSQIFLFGLISVLMFHIYFLDKAYFGLKIDDIQIGGLTKEAISEKLSASKEPEVINLVFEEKTFQVYPKDFNFNYNLSKTADNALAYGKRKNLISSLKHKFEAARGLVYLPFAYEFEEDNFTETISLLSSHISIPPIEPEVSLNKNKAVVNPGQKGFTVKEDELKNKILESLEKNNTSPISIPVQHKNPQLSETEIDELTKKAESLLGKEIIITFDYQEFKYDSIRLVKLLMPSGFKEEKVNEIIDEVAAVVERPPQDAHFVFEKGRVKEFAPALKGVKLNKEKIKQDFTNNLQKLLSENKKSSIFKLTVVLTNPNIDNVDVNNLGIKELIGRGSSVYKGSIPGRIHNIALAASRINSVLIKPGETFSFVNTIGEITNGTGYQPAYVISGGKTILDDGGGVCQVSTTLFRAALNTGLPITERHDHAYRVSYYEQDAKPGFDAAIFNPSLDLKFYNNTPAHILIQAKVDKTNSTLIFELYGTPDGRKVEISNQKLWDIRPAPAPLYKDEPTLPIGKTKQIDFASPGGKAAFDYKVTRGEEILEQKTFISNYRAWQAVFLRGTAPAQ